VKVREKETDESPEKRYGAGGLQERKKPSEKLCFRKRGRAETAGRAKRSPALL